MASLSTSFGGFFERSINQMNNLRAQIDRQQTQIATGQRIERSSQDPAGAAQLRVLDRRARLDDAASQNAAQLAQDLGTATSQLDAVTGLLQRARELAVAAANDPLGDTGRKAIAVELGQLEIELLARANAANAAGDPLFAGLAAGPAFVREAAGGVTYAGTAEVGAVQLAPGTAIERGLPGAQIFEFEQGGGATNAFAVLSTLAAALSGGAGDPAAAAREAISGLDAALDSTSRAQTILGTRAAWVEMVRQDQDLRSIDLAERRSEIGDTRLDEAIIRLQKTLTALEASQGAFVKVSGLNLFRALS
ncbi:MAG: flagellar hook-associated protein FlgL [Erythrobacter sp.]